MRRYPRKFKKGQWKATCQRCGFHFHSGEMRQEWNGLRVCKYCYDPRQSQDFVRGRAENEAPPWVAAEPTPEFGEGSKDDL
ncbi:MAG: hypothetical protein AAFU68_02725 [Pseudomonadota bacterium]